MFIKRLLSISLVMTMLLTLVTSSPTISAVSSESQHITCSYNNESTNRILGRDSESSISTYSDSKISLDLFEEQDGYYRTTGTIIIDEVYSFEASGSLDKYDVLTSEGTHADGLIGYLNGFTSDDNENITVSVHAVPSCNKYFLFVSVGMFDGQNEAETYIFGESFEEMNQLVDYYNIDHYGVSVYDMVDETTDIIIEDIVDSTSDFTSTVDFASTVALDGSEKLQTVLYTYYQLGYTDNYIPLTALSLYSPSHMQSNSIYPAHVKLNASTTNILAFLRYRYVGVYSANVLSGSCGMSSPSNYMGITTTWPENGEMFNIDYWVPTWILGDYGWMFKLVELIYNIGFNRISSTLGYSAGGLPSSVTWFHGYSRETSWTDYGPEATTNGYHGGMLFGYMGGPELTNLTLQGNGYVNISFSGNDGTFYNGSITIGSATASTSIAINY